MLIKTLATQNNKYIYDGFNNTLVDAEDKICNDIDNKNFSSIYFDFINKHNLRDFRDIRKHNIKFRISDELKYMMYNMRQQLILNITDNCNMRCKYCSYHDDRYGVDDYQYTSMSTQMAEKAIDDYIEASRGLDELGVTFFGGEPLLNFDLIKHCIEYANMNNYGQNIYYSISTNGILLTPGICDYLIDNNIRILVSLDGPKYVHDRYRVDINGDGTYERILSNFKYIKYKNYEYFKKNISYNTVLHPPYDDDHVYPFFDDIDICNLLDVTYSKTFTDYLFKKEISKNIDKEYDWKKFNKSQDKYLKTLLRFHKLVKIENPSEGVFQSSYCVPLYRKMGVTADGKYTLCERSNDEHLTIGNVSDGVQFERIEALYSDALDIMNKNCKECWAFHLCTICFVNSNQINNLFCNNMRNTIAKNFETYLDLRENDTVLFTMLERM